MSYVVMKQYLTTFGLVAAIQRAVNASPDAIVAFEHYGATL
jgi:hypothetical protein